MTFFKNQTVFLIQIWNSDDKKERRSFCESLQRNNWAALAFSGWLHTRLVEKLSEAATDFYLWNNKSTHLYRWDTRADWGLLSHLPLLVLPRDWAHSWSDHFHGEQKAIFHGRRTNYDLPEFLKWKNNNNNNKQTNKKPAQTKIPLGTGEINHDNSLLSFSSRTHPRAFSLLSSVVLLRRDAHPWLFRWWIVLPCRLGQQLPPCQGKLPTAVWLNHPHYLKEPSAPCLLVLWEQTPSKCSSVRCDKFKPKSSPVCWKCLWGIIEHFTRGEL